MSPGRSPANAGQLPHGSRSSGPDRTAASDAARRGTAAQSSSGRGTRRTEVTTVTQRRERMTAILAEQVRSLARSRRRGLTTHATRAETSAISGLDGLEATTRHLAARRGPDPARSAPDLARRVSKRIGPAYCRAHFGACDQHAGSQLHGVGLRPMADGSGLRAFGSTGLGSWFGCDWLVSAPRGLPAWETTIRCRW